MPHSILPDHTQIENLFRAWFQETYGIPPNPHAVMVSTGFAEWLLTNDPEPKAEK